ncbi:hypothetical protein ACLB0R_09935 [Sphingomonas sp. GlSt437]|uniref:hypothetical protein n=1 Tax=Sphingomonas sp. GlSt437 TaxID=3389970 RepID=UPI003A8A2894
MVDIQQRLRPGVLLREAVEDMRHTGLDLLKTSLAKARDNPGPLLGIGALVAAYLSKDFLAGTAPHNRDGATDHAPPPDAAQPAIAKAKPKAKPKTKKAKPAKSKGSSDD